MVRIAARSIPLTAACTRWRAVRRSVNVSTQACSTGSGWPAGPSSRISLASTSRFLTRSRSSAVAALVKVTTRIRSIGIACSPTSRSTSMAMA